MVILFGGRCVDTDLEKIAIVNDKGEEETKWSHLTAFSRTKKVDPWYQLFGCKTTASTSCRRHRQEEKEFQKLFFCQQQRHAGVRYRPSQGVSNPAPRTDRYGRGVGRVEQHRKQ